MSKGYAIKAIDEIKQIKSMNTDIKLLIAKYAEVYEAFEVFQKQGKLPIGDQKTGVIAEYYAKCYIEKILGVKAEYAKPGECFDLSYIDPKNNLIKIQVKGISAHSKTRIIAPLNLELVNGKPPFNYLYLISLDEDFMPDGFYINAYRDIEKKLTERKDQRRKIQGATMKGKNKQGYGLFDFTNNIEEKINQAIKQSK